MEFIEQPEIQRKRTKYKVREFVVELKQNPDRWAIYARPNGKSPRQAMVNTFSAVNRVRLRYPEIRWEACKDEQGWYIAAIYESGE